MKLTCVEYHDQMDRPVVRLFDLDTGLCYTSSFEAANGCELMHVFRIYSLHTSDATVRLEAEAADHMLGALMDQWKQHGVDHAIVKAQAAANANRRDLFPGHLPGQVQP